MGGKWHSESCLFWKERNRLQTPKLDKLSRKYAKADGIDRRLAATDISYDSDDVARLPISPLLLTSVIFWLCLSVFYVVRRYSRPARRTYGVSNAQSHPRMAHSKHSIMRV